MNNFQQTVYTLVQKIPKGKVATYGQLAKRAGSPGAVRLVGLFMKRNPNPSKIPCHRVVASDGNLTGYAFGEGISTKKAMLLKEGVAFIRDRVDLKKSEWRPLQSGASVKRRKQKNSDFKPLKLFLLIDYMDKWLYR